MLLIAFGKKEKEKYFPIQLKFQEKLLSTKGKLFHKMNPTIQLL
jgi:hypothetical protein